jgi:hypothetical protein
MVLASGPKSVARPNRQHKGWAGSQGDVLSEKGQG